MSRALTLIEVIAATALLAILVAACMPLLTAARRDLALAAPSATSDTANQALLELAVDHLIHLHPALPQQSLEQPRGLPVRWTWQDREYSGHVTLALHVLSARDEHRSEHAWLVIHAEDARCLRWVRVRSPRAGANP